MVSPRITIPTEELKKRRKTQTFTFEEARLQGIELAPDWTLRIDYGTNGDLPRQIFISPEKWEFSDFVYGEKGEVQDFSVVSPEGQAFTKAELEVLEAEPVITEIPEVEPPAIEALRLVFPESFLPEASFGFTEEEIPGMVLQQTATFARESQAEFISQLVAKGRTPEVETLINTFFDATPEDIDRLFEEMPEPELQAFSRLVLPFEGVRQLTVVDNTTGVVYDLEGKELGMWNPIAQEFQTKPKENIVKDFFDTIQFAGRQYWELGENTLLSLLPNLVFRDATPKQREVWGDTVADWHNRKVRDVRETFRFLYSENKQEYEEWIEKNPQLVPDVTFQEGAFQHPELLKDPRYYAYELASIVPFLVTTTGVAIATGGVGVPFVLGTAAIMTPIEAQSVYEDLINAGAPEGKVEELALIAGGLMGLLESAGRIPLLKQVSPVLFNRFKKEATKQLVKKGTAETIKRFGRAFTVNQFAEVTTEVMQEVVGNVAVSFYDENRGILDNIPDIAVKTAVATLLPGVTGGAVSARPTVRADVETRVKQAIEQAKERPEAGFVRIPGEKPEEVGRTLPVKEVSKLETRIPLELIRKDEAAEIERLTEEIRREGIKEPIVIRIREDGSQIVWDGIHRLIVAQDLGIKNIPVRFIGEEGLGVRRPPTKPQPPVTPEVTPPVAEEVARPEPGAPEAGIQPTMLPGEVAAREVRPPGKGRVTQISMDDQIKLQQARQAAEVAPEETKEAYEAQAEITGLQVTQESDLVAQKRIWIGKDKKGRDLYRGLDFFISLKEQNFPENFTLKQAKMLFPGHEFVGYSQPGTPQFNRVPRDAALDDLSKELNMTPDEIADRVMEIRQENRRVKDLKAAIKTTMTEKPLVPVNELTTEEVTENWQVVGRPKLTIKQAEALSGFFGNYVLSESTLTAFELQRALWSRTRTGRSQDFKSRMDELIVQGLGVEEAFNQSATETLAGKLPSVRTNFFEGMSNELRDALFTMVYHNKGMQAYPLEMASTITALTNAIDGKPIPRVRGKGSVLFPEGGSAWDRLNYVFGKQPKVLKAIEKMATEHKPLEDIVEGVFHETGREPIPIDQEAADYLRSLSDIPQGYKTLLEPPFDYPVVKDLRNPADLEFALADLDLQQQLAKGEITFEQFEIARAEARDKAYPLAPITKYEAPIEDAFKEIPLWPRPVRDNVVRALKELGWLPVDIGNFLRANKASFDFSFWRQQAPLIAGHPITFAQANIEAWKALWSQKSTEASWEKITRDPLYQLYDLAAEEGGDFLRPIQLKKGTAQWRGTEEFGYITGDRLLPRLTGRLPWVKLSARAFETGTNVHNWLIFKNFYNAMLNLSEQYASGKKKLKLGEAFDIQKEMRDFAKMLANFSARGSLGKFKAAAPELSGLFFAPRASVGRILSVKDLINANPRVRLEAWKNAATFVSTLGGIILLGAAMGWWDVEKDPRNAEYMSIRIGNVRVDPWGGFRQFLVFFTRAITGTGVSSVTGAEYEADPIHLIQTLIRGKASPIASLILDFWRGKNFIGEEVDVADKRQWAERIAPFAVWDIYEAYQEDPPTALQVAIPAIVGAGVQTYTGDWRENFLKLGLTKYTDNLAYGLKEPYYDTADFWTDTSSQFKGVDPTTLTEAKGFPPYIKAIAEARIINEHLSTLPSDKLVNLNADPVAGTTFPQYYKMWRDREKLVAAGDEAEITIEGETFKGEEAVKEFDKDERTKNAHRGNFTQRQFALLNEYWSITDEKKQAEFLEEHKAEIGVKPRDEYLRTHPQENAELAIWGQAKVLTKEAYEHFNTLAKKYDIPDNAIPELLLPPETSIDTHFDYEEMVSDGTHSSNEAKLLLLKDQIAADEAKVQSFVGWRNATNQPLKLPAEQLEYYQMKVDNQQNYDDLEEAQEADNEEEVEAIRARKVDGETFHDVERRIEAMGKGTREVPIDPELVNSYVNHMRIGDETSPNSAESKLNRYDDLVINEFLMNTDYWGKQKAQSLDKDRDYLDNYLVPRWRIDVQYRTEDSEYNALQTTSERQQYLLDNEAYRMDRRRREALTMVNVQTGERFPLDQVEQFVSYYEIEAKGFRNERFIIENQPFAQKMFDITGQDIWKTRPEDVPNVAYDDITDQYKETFDLIDAFQDANSPDYKDNTIKGFDGLTDRKRAVEALKFDADGKLTEFGLADLTRYAHDRLRSIQANENYSGFINDFVGYYTLEREGIPDNYEEVNKTNLYYEDDWYMLEHFAFYKEIYQGLLGNEPFEAIAKVPTRAVFAKYLQYLQIDSRQAKLRDDFRWDNLDLDDWLVLKFEYTPVTEKRRRAALTPGERLAGSIAELERRLREVPREAPPITILR